MSSQASSAPEVPSTRTRLRNWLSILLTAGGLGLMAWGGWMVVQQWIEASQPPPARIVEVSLADLEATPSPVPPTNTPVPTATRASAGDTLTRPAPVAASVAEPTPAPAKIAPTQEEPAAAPADSSGSLADNPLPVIETAPTPAAAGQPATLQIANSERAPLTRIVAESIKLDAPVIEVGWEVVIQNSVPVNVWKVADYAAGWHKNSLLPGEGGNVVLSGHHNINGEVFRYIVDLEPGDIVTLIDAAGQSYAYAVEDKFIVKDKGEPEAVRRANARWIGPFNDERLTLVTCWPYNNNTHRVIVIAKPVTP